MCYKIQNRSVKVPFTLRFWVGKNCPFALPHHPLHRFAVPLPTGRALGAESQLPHQLRWSPPSFYPTGRKDGECPEGIIIPQLYFVLCTLNSEKNRALPGFFYNTINIFGWDDKYSMPSSNARRYSKNRFLFASSRLFIAGNFTVNGFTCLPSLIIS